MRAVVWRGGDCMSSAAGEAALRASSPERVHRIQCAVTRRLTES